MIKEFEDIASNYHIPVDILQKIEDDISAMGSRPVRLTALQKETINNPKFWCSSDSSTNVIIQGATSSGKTLAAELLALQSVFSMNKHVVYLVPLKALVSEKCHKFEQDIYNEERRIQIKIFASSSDYQDHDAELAEGQYDIAVVVYEKFFAMLAEQRDNKFLEKCGLIIVDEIQLLGSQDRGAKLEYSLTKVRNNFQGSIRILGLTTVDCDTNYVNKWLDAEIIKNSQRPIGLKEKIISLNGLYWERQIDGENERQNTENKEGHKEGKIEVEGAEKLKNQKIDIKRTALLCSLLKKINDEDSEKKIIVFASSRERCKKTARNIAKSDVFEKRIVSVQLENELEKTDDESEKTLLQNELLPFGIAYHSAALPMSLRELIESEFKNNNGSIRLIVATETITIGMNLPADVMILFDNKVFRGSDGAVDLRPQEYKNYIGRAGRLGITDKVGESYLFVNTDSDIPYYWEQYVNCRIEEVSSALLNATPRETAPYYLNLLCKGKEVVFSEHTITGLAEKTLSASEISIKKRAYTIDTSKIIKDFKKVELIRDKDTEENELDDDEKIGTLYELTNFGEALAPYALSIKTCFQIKKYFKDEANKNGKSGGLPLEYSGEDLKKNKYLIDILFTVCSMDEVNRIRHPRLPEPNNPRNREMYLFIETTISEYLKKYKKEEGDDAFWENSKVEKVFFSEEDIETDQLNAALRAILLFHWIKGELPSQMQEKTGLKKNKEFIWYTGDMIRIGESCSYILEAVSKCLFANKKRPNNLIELERAFYSLSLKLKYGLSNPNLIQVANRHVYGLSRSTIIEMDKAAHNYGFDNINLFIRSSNKKVLKYLTKMQRNELIRQMSERYDDKNIDNLIEKLIQDEIIDGSLQSDFNTIANPKQLDQWLESTKNVFAYLDEVKQVPIRSSNIKGIKLQWENHELYMVLLFDKRIVSAEKSNVYREQLRLTAGDKLLFLYNRDIEFDPENDNDILISAHYFSKIILEFLALSACTKASGMCDYLYKQTGFVSDHGMLSLQKNIEEILEHHHSGNKNYADDEDLSSYDKYIRKYNYEDIQIIDNCYGHAVMHKVKSRQDEGEYVIKEIVIPENIEEFEALERKAGELFKEFDSDITKIREFMQNDYGDKLLDKDIDKIIQMAQEREAQLIDGIENKSLYYLQSIVFLAEGYKRLQEVRIAAKVKGLHIVDTYNPEIFHVDYEHSSLNSVDKKFNRLCSHLFFTMPSYDGDANVKHLDLQGNEKEIKNIGIQICEALIACHKEKILHRDIKPANILFRNDHEYYLCDFGSAVKINDGKTLGVGTNRFMSPESINGEYTEKSDIYSLGKTLQCLYEGDAEKNPENFKDDKLTEVLRKASEVDSSKRYDSAELFKNALENV